MNMIREIIRPSSEYYSLHIPKEYIDKDIEILVLPFEYPEDKKQSVSKNKQLLQKTAGLLTSRNIDPLKWQQVIRAEYDR